MDITKEEIVKKRDKEKYRAYIYLYNNKNIESRSSNWNNRKLIRSKRFIKGINNK